VTLYGMGMYEFDEHVCHGRDGFARNDFAAMVLSVSAGGLGSNL
jgi:hypothetical protein